MTTATAMLGRRSGLITPTRSTARSESATRLTDIREQIRRHLLDSYTVRRAAEGALNELDEVRMEASFEGWNGYGAKPMHPDAYQNARLFLEAMPTTAPSPEISADADGDVALDWVFGERKALSVSIGAAGRCTFAWMRGLRTYRGTDWLDDDGIPAPIANALWQLARDTVQVRQIG
jgi:hypothetical protein